MRDQGGPRSDQGGTKEGKGRTKESQGGTKEGKVRPERAPSELQRPNASRGAERRAIGSPSERVYEKGTPKRDVGPSKEGPKAKYQSLSEVGLRSARLMLRTLEPKDFGS